MITNIYNYFKCLFVATIHKLATSVEKHYKLERHYKLQRNKMTETKKIKLESLEIKAHGFDRKIDALNILATLKIKDYLDIASSIKNNNDLQRRRVSNPSTVYALLKEDLIAGCLIPPIVLAMDADEKIVFEDDKIDYKIIQDSIRNSAENLKIIDGLQRTNILLDLRNELNETTNKEEYEIAINHAKLKSILENELRIELNLNITRFGILYRMLTLNTGQTPMSLRHQIEILYSDYYINEKDGVTLLRDAFESTKIVKLGQYKFSEIVEGVTSYIDGSEFTLDRFDLLNYTKSIKKLSADDTKIDIFNSFVSIYHLLISQMIDKSDGWRFDFNQLSQENLNYFPIQKKDSETGKETRNNPFGQTAEEIFLKSQIYTGFGAALTVLRDKSIISEITDLRDIIEKISFETTPKDAFELMMVRLEQIRKDSKKIGESQRTFFKFFFTSIFNVNDLDSYLIFEKAVELAYRKTI